MAISYSFHIFENQKNKENLLINIIDIKMNTNNQKSWFLMTLFFFIDMNNIKMHNVKVRVAQRIARWTSNPEVVGSNPTVDAFFSFR